MTTYFYLTGFGKDFVATGETRGYGYVKGGATGHFGKAACGKVAKQIAAALEKGDICELQKLVEKSPTFRLHERIGNADWRPLYSLSRKGTNLGNWYSSRRTEYGWPEPTLIIE